MRLITVDEFGKYFILFKKAWVVCESPPGPSNAQDRIRVRRRQMLGFPLRPADPNRGERERIAMAGRPGSLPEVTVIKLFWSAADAGAKSSLNLCKRWRYRLQHSAAAEMVSECGV